MNILVTGANGQLGSEIRILAEQPDLLIEYTDKETDKDALLTVINSTTDDCGED